MAKGKSDKHYYVVGILGGLGSQMFKYAFYLLLNEKSPNTLNYIDTYSYQCEKVWNGYELQKLFGISAPDIADELGENVDSSNYVYDFFMKKQPNSKIIFSSRGQYKYLNSKYAKIEKIVDKVLFKGRYLSQKVINPYTKKYGYYVDKYRKNWNRLNANVYFGEFNFTSDFYFKSIRQKLLQEFTFPVFQDENNMKYSERMMKEESVAIHIRRSDHMYDNMHLFQDKYYEKAIAYMKEYLENPVFYIFSDETKWCMDHREELGFQKEDTLIAVDWNYGENSYCDMQLMTYAKHNILAISSFSWWGYYLSKHENKKVCAPAGYWLEVEKHF